VNIKKQGTNVQLYQNDLTLQGGETYQLRLAARSSGGQDVKLFLHEHSAPYASYGLNGIQLDLTSAWQVFVVEFTAKGNTTLTDGRLRLWLAPFDQNNMTFEFDDVVLLPKSMAGVPFAAPTESTLGRRPKPQVSQGQPANVVLQQGYFLDGDEDGRLNGAYLPENGESLCYNARASRSELFPANGKLVKVRILGVGKPRNVVITGITQNELVGPTPDGYGVGSSSAKLRRERDETGEGRVYHIAFTATYKGNTCSHEVVVTVPLDRGTPAIDSGAQVDSTQPTR
jgi:hypothetical protein